MAVVGFSFSKISAEKKKGMQDKVNINNNVSIKSVQEADLALGAAKQKGVRFEFIFTSDYSPDVAMITLEGELLYVGQDAIVKEVLDSWKKEKKLSKSVTSEIFNNILSRCNVEAIVISREINVPPPIPMPKVDSKK